MQKGKKVLHGKESMYIFKKCLSYIMVNSLVDVPSRRLK